MLHGLPLPRLPAALARHQESHPLKPAKKELPSLSPTVISLEQMCSKYWLERIQYALCKGLPRAQVFILQRYLSHLPRGLRTTMIHNALKSGGLHLAHGKEVPAVNRALVFLTSDIIVCEPVYISLPAGGPDGIDTPTEVDLIVRNGEGLRHLVVSLPAFTNKDVKKLFTDICRTCRNIRRLQVVNATDDILTIATRHLPELVYLDVSGSPGVTDDGLNRVIVNLRWGDSNENIKIKHLDVGKTSVTPEAVCNTLSRLPTLTSMGSTDIIMAMEVLNEVGVEGLTTELQEVTLPCATFPHLRFLSHFCPKLKKINVIFIQTPGPTLNDLRLLPNLSHLCLTVREPFLLSPTVLYDFTWAMGVKLVTLRVSGDVYWEADLGLIAGHCPMLEDLALPAVTFPNKESLNVLLASSTPTLSNLKVLELDCMTGVGPKAWAKDFALARKGLVAALRKCHQLRHFVFRPTTLVDTDLLEILAVNPLPKLEVLELYNSVLGLVAARMVVDTCQNLHVMKGLRTWRGLTLHDLVLLRKHVRGHRRASELKIIP